jgi:chromosome segregation ATPase
VIRRLHIRGWRAFDDLAIDLEEGVTFVIAENGVGKTSLVQAAAWGLYGPLSGVDARAARRIGSAETRVEVDLDLPDGRTLSVVRQAQERASPMRASIGGAPVDEDAMAQVLADAYGASREFLSRTTLIPGDAIADDAASAMPLRAHLCRVFGVDDLQAAADELQRLHGEADTAAKKLRQATRRATTDLMALRDALAGAEAATTQTEASLTSARAALQDAEQRLNDARQDESARASAAAARQAFDELLASARPFLGPEVFEGVAAGPAELASRLEASEATAADVLDDLRREAAAVAGSLDAVRAAASELRSAGAECPVCRRELSAEDVARASQVHKEEMDRLSARDGELTAMIGSASSRLNDIRALMKQAARLPEIESPLGGAAADVTAAELAVDHARQQFDRLVEQLTEARSRRASLAAQIAEEEQSARDTQEVGLAHQREAVTSVAAEVLRSTADAILTERIDPLAAEIAHRWKRIFGDRGALRLRPDGRLILARGINEIPFTEFSGGEKVVALLAVRLLVLGASTRASFLWLDEPLEHLDPKNRRIIASLMTASGKHIRQILVTTYEEPLARRLAKAAHAELRYVRASPS